nr:MULTISPECIES: hypothetical protein [Alphaproteobacteria]
MAQSTTVEMVTARLLLLRPHSGCYRNGSGDTANRAANSQRSGEGTLETEPPGNEEDDTEGNYRDDRRLNNGDRPGQGNK